MTYGHAYFPAIPLAGFALMSICPLAFCLAALAIVGALMARSWAER